MRYGILGSISAMAIMLASGAAAQGQSRDTEQLDRVVIEQQAEALARREAAIAERIAREKAGELAAGDISANEIAASAAVEAAAEAMEAAAEAAEEVFMPSATAVAMDADEAEDSSDYYALTPEKLIEWAGDGYSYGTGDNPRLYRFEKRAKAALADGDLAFAATRLARDYGVDPGKMRQFLEANLTIEIHAYALDQEPAYADYRQVLIEALRALDHADFAVVAAVEALSSVAECQAGDWDAVMEGAANRVDTAWLIAQTDECTSNFVRFLETAPSHAMPMMIEMAHYGTIEAAGSLPIYEWLTQEAPLARIAPHNRQWLETALRRRFLDKLLMAGMNERALELVDGLSGEQRAAVLAPDERSFVAEVDGLPVYIEGDRQTAGLQTNLAAAYAFAGREEEAVALFSSLPKLEETRAWFACWVENRKEPEDVCKDDFGRPTEMLLLDHLFNSPDSDPYPLAEALFSGSLSDSSSGAMAEIRCELFAADRFGDVCSSGRRQVAYLLTAHQHEHDKPDHDAAMAAIARLGLPGWQDIAGRYETLVRKRIEEAGGPPDTRRYERGSIDPLPSPFAENPLPDGIEPIEPEQKAWPASWAGLPDGYYPVRWERRDAHITAVSVSRIYDPSGEISMGGYWVHLSDDGGVNWQEPLYTGLSEFFPYSVRPASALPLRDEERVTLEVSIKQIDTASITYPPVALRPKREQEGIYLDIPLAALRKDSDGDGMTDIAEAHLLLDREGTDAPAILGRIGGSDCSGQPTREKLARIAILRELFKIESRPIIEPLVRSSDDPLSFGEWRTARNGIAAPLFLKGDPQDFACMSADRLVIIYSEEHIEALQRRTPDFRTVELPQIVWNAARDRGYVKWSAGWTGGTLRLIWNGEDWDLTQTSSWIT